MSDEPPKDEETPLGEVDLMARYRDQSLFTIPDEALQRWTQLSPDRRITVTLRRQDLDHLFFGFGALAAAVVEMQQTVIALSHNQVEKANEEYDKSAVSVAVAYNNIRRMFAGLISEACPYDEAE